MRVINLLRDSVWAAPLVGLVCVAVLQAQDSRRVVPLPRAHAHNDYRHNRPLLDALDRGFCSVEADIFLVDGKLLVGHDRGELRQERTLQALYLDPLRDLARENGGRIYPDGPALTLLIDIKESGEATYKVLRRVLAEYGDIISSVENEVLQSRAVQVVVSGDRPWDAIKADALRYAGIDGRLTDLDSELPAHLLPLISDRWTSHFGWRGVGKFPAEERAKLHSIVERAHANDRRVRFWATPEDPKVWQELLDAGVDHINTDRLDELQGFLLARSPGEYSPFEK